MALLAVVLFFVILAAIALFLAMTGGPRGARETLQTQSRRGRKGAMLAFIASLIVLGIAVPALVIASEHNRTAIPEANVGELTSLQERGRELFGQRCRNCHSLKASNATAAIGPNLDDLRPPKSLVLDAIEKGRAQGNGNMAANIVEGGDAEAVAQYVALAVGEDPNAE
jgi:mono/diheme cytochrome c family protein